MNQSINQDHMIITESLSSPKNLHQIQSKNKLSINSPTVKFDTNFNFQQNNRVTDFNYRDKKDN